LDGYGFLGAVWIAPEQFFDPGLFFIDIDGNPTALGNNGHFPSCTAPSI